MTTRSLGKTMVFSKNSRLAGIGRVPPAGDYRVLTNEELIEGLSFPVYRRVATMMFVPARSRPTSSVELVTIDPLELQPAQDRDASC